jgi:hypothetical protein
MREMAAIEALKSEKSEKEVRWVLYQNPAIAYLSFTSENFKYSQTRPARRATRSFVSVRSVERIFRSLTQIVVWRITLVAKYVHSLKPRSERRS